MFKASFSNKLCFISYLKSENKLVNFLQYHVFLLKNCFIFILIKKSYNNFRVEKVIKNFLITKTKKLFCLFLYYFLYLRTFSQLNFFNVLIYLTMVYLADIEFLFKLMTS